MPAHTRRLVRSAASWPICSLTRRSTSSPPAVRSAARSGHGLEADRGAPACSSATNASHSASRSWRTRRRRMARRSRQAARRRPPQRLTGAASRDASCRGAGTVYRGPVARPAADYMMSALARRLSYEDRLTELLASVLKGDAELRAELLHRRARRFRCRPAGGPGPHWRRPADNGHAHPAERHRGGRRRGVVGAQARRGGSATASSKRTSGRSYAAAPRAPRFISRSSPTNDAGGPAPGSSDASTPSAPSCRAGTASPKPSKPSSSSSIRTGTRSPLRRARRPASACWRNWRRISRTARRLP